MKMVLGGLEGSKKGGNGEDGFMIWGKQGKRRKGIHHIVGREKERGCGRGGGKERIGS